MTHTELCQDVQDHIKACTRGTGDQAFEATERPMPPAMPGFSVLTVEMGPPGSLDLGKLIAALRSRYEGVTGPELHLGRKDTCIAINVDADGRHLLIWIIAESLPFFGPAS
jgi:hypothetical protein